MSDKGTTLTRRKSLPNSSKQRADPSTVLSGSTSVSNVNHTLQIESGIPKIQEEVSSLSISIHSLKQSLGSSTKKLSALKERYEHVQPQLSPPTSLNEYDMTGLHSMMNELRQQIDDLTQQIQRCTTTLNAMQCKIPQKEDVNDPIMLRSIKGHLQGIKARFKQRLTNSPGGMTENTRSEGQCGHQINMQKQIDQQSTGQYVDNEVRSSSLQRLRELFKKYFCRRAARVAPSGDHGESTICFGCVLPCLPKSFFTIYTPVNKLRISR